MATLLKIFKDIRRSMPDRRLDYWIRKLEEERKWRKKG